MLNKLYYRLLLCFIYPLAWLPKQVLFYFNKLSMTWQDFQEREFLIALSYHKFINNLPFDVTFESKKFTNRRDSIAQERKRKQEINIKADSIDGIFIPADLKSCFVELDRLLNDTTKLKIKNIQDSLEFVGEYHMGLGRWMRNAWGLWSGSRLKVYFHDRKIFHPDEISSIILESYAKYLNDETFDADEIIQIIHIQHEEFMRNLELGSTGIVFTAPKIKYSRNYRRFLYFRLFGRKRSLNIPYLGIDITRPLHHLSIPEKIP